MGRPTVDQAIGYLTERSIRAAKGYPNSPIPELKGVAVAVNVHKADDTGISHSAVVCMPLVGGASQCEVIADWVASVWSLNGASCSWNGCEFDDTMGVFTATVIGRWEISAGKTE